MKKRLPLILSVLGIVIIISAAAIVYKIYFEGKAVKETATPLVAPAAPHLKPLPQLPKTPEPAKTVGTGVEAKRSEMSSEGAPGKVDETTVPPIAYEYNPKGRRDPFATLIMKVEPQRKKGGVPLQNYGVHEFKLTAVLWSKSGYFALVAAPDGRSFAVREGTTIGLRGGKVDKITKDSVIIKEFLKDYRGRVKPNNTVLKLHREEE
jgi:type IV pilus assembly protein PilP